MVEIGKIQQLQIETIVSIGAYLDAGTTNPDDDILLPNNQLPDGAKEGDVLDVFIYRDSEDRLIATCKTPYAQVGDIASLQVIENTQIGSFLDWGLEKDLFLPFSEQAYRVQEGKKYLVAVYLDKRGRLCATMNLEPYLRTDSPYKQGDFVTGTVYLVNRDFGAFVVVDNQYSGIIPENEYFQPVHPGTQMTLRVVRVREDGKLYLSPREQAYKEIDRDAETILQTLIAHDGLLPFHDKTHPASIKKYFRISKKAFKRAVGRLMKEGKIEQTDDGLRLLQQPKSRPKSQSRGSKKGKHRKIRHEDTKTRRRKDSN